MKTIRKCAIVTGILGAMLLVPAVAWASGATTSISLTGGSLAFTTAPSASNFAATALTGAQQTIHADFASWGVDDATGSGAGWHVTFQASQFSDGSGDTLPAGSLVLTAPVITPAGVNLATEPTTSGSSFTLDGGSAVTVATAASGAGQGSWTMTQGNLDGGDLALTVPASAIAGTYTSNLTFTLATGP